MRKCVAGAILAVLLFVAGCTPVPMQPSLQVDAPTEMVVFAAASLTDAFDTLGAQFEGAHPGVQVTFNYAGSNQLAQQLGSGAPADVFASANQRQMDAAVEAGRIEADSVQPFVRNRLVVVVAPDIPAELATLQDLTKPGVKLVLADAAVPVGQYSLDFLGKASADPGFTTTYSETVMANVVSFEENVRAVLNKVELGEADAGIVYTSDIGPKQRSKLTTIDIPDALNVVATYPIAPVADSAASALAADFVGFVLAPEGQAILEEYGFIGIEP